MTKIQKYKKLLKMLNGLDAEGILPNEIDSRYQVEAVIFTEELKEKFRMNLPVLHDTWCKVDEFSILCLMGTKYNRRISWPDDDRQPEDEWLYSLSFPCGAYTFNRDHYPTATFNAFFNALKELGPKYCDTVNHNLYFTHENAAEAYAKYKELFAHFMSQVQVEIDARRIEQLKKELAALEEKK